MIQAPTKYPFWDAILFPQPLSCVLFVSSPFRISLWPEPEVLHRLVSGRSILPSFACHEPAITYRRDTQKLMLYNFRNKLSSIIFKMTRRSRSPSPTLEVTSPRLAKRPRLDFTPLTPEDYKDGVMLAPMVRSGACAFLIPPTSYWFASFWCLVPTRLFALKHGATLVWGPEIVDKAILHSERVVDREFVTISLSPSLIGV